MKILMKLKSVLSFLASFAFLSAVAQPSASYYKRVDGYKQASLKSVLKGIISNHTKISYGSLWEAYEKVDYLPKTNSKGQHLIMDYYSESLHYFEGDGDAPSGMNKEHVAPQSWWGSGTNNGVGSDLFQVLPSEAQANSAKSNYPLGVVSGNVSSSNARMKTGKDKKGQMVFEPCDEYKGDFARIYLYVATCYPTVGWIAYNSSTNNTAFKNEEYPTLTPAMMALMLEWHKKDPVSDWEITRNNRVEKVQGNRNPFIDYPDLAFYIWGEKTNEAFDLDSQTLYTFSDGTGGGGNVDPDPIDPDPEDPSIQEGDTIFFEPFTDVAEGNDYDTGSSGSLWNGNSNFTSVTTAYQAGGAVRLGTSKKVGTLTTRAISFAGGKLIVEIDVKGWTSVEGTIQLCVDGGPATSHEYKATITDAYETLRIDLKDVPKNPYFTISTSEKRCFIDEIRVLVPKNDTEAIELLPQDSSTVSDYVDLSGRRYKNLPKKKGVYIHHRKKIVRN